MKHLHYGWTIAIASLLCACSSTPESPVSLRWEMGANDVAPGFYSSTFTLVNNSDKPLEGDWEIYYNQIIPFGVKALENSPVDFKMVNAGYYRMSPNEAWQTLAPGDSICIEYWNGGAFSQTQFRPRAPFFVNADDQAIEIPFTVAPYTRKEQWMASEARRPAYPDGETVYAHNEALATDYTVQPYDMIPSLKEITPREGVSTVSKEISLSVEEGFANEAKLLIEELKAIGYNVTKNGQTVIALCSFRKGTPVVNDEHYRLDVRDNYITISGSTPHAIFNGTQTLVSLLKRQSIPAKLENIAISDYPDFAYRGMMIDISRNYIKQPDVLKLIDQLAAYKINTLHFHFSDDEGWRLEIPGLEELTEIGSRRGFTRDESEWLYPSYYGGCCPDDTTSTGNGFYTRDQFIELLKYAAARHIAVIPEIESPGHARAAIKAMRTRYNRLKNTDLAKAEEYLLYEEADSSKYVSAQGYSDNIMNVAMPSVYRFMEKVTDELIAMYDEAGVPLTTIHFGGDEVPGGAWKGSPLCHQFMAEKGMKETRELAVYFIDKVTETLYAKGIKVIGWQEVALNHSAELNSKLTSRFAGVNGWSTIGDSDIVPYTIANSGYNVILCNVNNTYIDLAYNTHRDEPGLFWGGFVDEFASFNLLPYNIYASARTNTAGEKNDLRTIGKGKVQLKPEARKHIIGVQAQLFGETIGSFDMVQYYTFPKIFGVVERAWNASPAWSPTPANDHQAEYEEARAIYNAKIAEIELPRLALDGFRFRLAQPGIRIVDGKLYANSPIPQAEIRYTTDGSEPTATSTLWKAPVDCDASFVKAKLFYLGKESLSTELDKR